MEEKKEQKKKEKSQSKSYQEISQEKLKFSERITRFIGSWTFIIVFVIFVFAWIGLNLFALVGRFDPYPYILLNLTLSCLAAVQAPIIMMAQNKEARRDRKKAEVDYKVNRQSEKEIEEIQEDLNEIKRLIRKDTAEAREREGEKDEK